MAEYICREAILDDIEREIEAGNVALDEDVWINKGLRIAIRDIKDIKVSDVQPVKRGRWLPKSEDDIYEFSECSECGNIESCETPYCAQCGARMIKDGDKK